MNLIYRLRDKALPIVTALVFVAGVGVTMYQGGAAAASDKTSPFCSNLSSEQSKVTTDLNNLISNASDRWADHSQSWQNIWANVDSKVATNRQNADTERQSDFDNLLSRAKTTDEKTAVSVYIAAINNAVSVRRAAYDSARETFRTGVNNAVSGRSTTVTGQFSEFQSAVNSAFATAQASCSSNPSDGPAIRSTFQASLKSARLSFRSQRSGDTTVLSEVKQLEQTRDSAFKAAGQAFQSAAKAARQTLLQAFNSSDKNSSTIN